LSTGTLSGSVRIDPVRGWMRYDRQIFGQFLEHFHRVVYGGVFEPGSPLADEKGFRLDVIAALRELRVPVVRWPGGCFVSAYHWMDGIGPNRQPVYDKAWMVEDSNQFGTDEFVDWCRLIGAEPYICTNAGSGSPEEMSDWVEYCNLPAAGRWACMRQANGFAQPHNVRYWSIGNENYGDWEMGAKTASEWGSYVAESAKMMKRVDPSIHLLAAALPDVDWTLGLLRKAGKYLDTVSIHYYGDPLWQEDKPSSYSACMSRLDQPEKVIRLTEQIIAVAGYEGKIGIAFDEWNLRGWHHPFQGTPAAIAERRRNDLNSTYTTADAVFSAAILNTFLRHAESVRMANMAPVVNGRGPLYVHPGGLVKRTTFHVLQMFANLLEENVADAWTGGERLEGSEIQALDAAATCDSAGKIWRLVLVNRHNDQNLACQVTLDGRPLEGEYAATMLCGDAPDAYNDVEFPERVRPEKRVLAFSAGKVSLPPHSVTIIGPILI
jgi:alpha-N-arabinofuranosidase